MEILDSIISLDISLPSGVYAAIGKQIASKNIVVVLGANTLPIVFICDYLIFRKVLEKFVCLRCINFYNRIAANRILNNHV
jgi:hypothetical protein